MEEFTEFYVELRDVIALAVAEVVADIGNPTTDDVLFEVLIASNLIALCKEAEEEYAKYHVVLIALLKRIQAMIELAYSLNSTHVQEIWLDVLKAAKAVLEPDLLAALLRLKQAKLLIHRVSKVGNDDFDTFNSLQPLLRTFKKRLSLRKELTPGRWNELHAIIYALTAAARREEFDLDTEPISEHFNYCLLALSKRVSVKTLSDHVGGLLGILFQHIN
jgi:hypothetical protein